MITSEELQELREVYLDNIKHFITQSGGLDPHITVFAEHKNPDGKESKNAVIHMPIPGKYMKSDAGKQAFVDQVVPKVAKEVSRDFDCAAVAWAAEAWVRTAPAGESIDVANYKDLPIQKEILIVTFESANTQNVTIYDIIRKGKQINKHGDLVDHIDLVPDDTMSGASYPEGRFTGLYKKFVECA